MLDYRFKFPLPNGLHARPASHFEAVTGKFRSRITLIHEGTSFRANARSVLSLVSADVRQNDPIWIQIEGEDEQPAFDAVRKFITDELPYVDEALPPVAAGNGVVDIPRSLKAAGLQHFIRGFPVSGGVGGGRVVVIGGMAIPAELKNEIATDPAYEQKRADDAIAAVAESLQAKIEAAKQPQEQAVLMAHAAIVRDVALAEMISALITLKQRTAGQAIVEACQSFTETLGKSQSAYLRERILDVEDICMKLLDQLGNCAGDCSETILSGPSICVAEHLTPGQLLALDRQYLKGLVLSEGGTTSHTVILARAMNIPTLVGAEHATTAVRPGQEAIVDGELGVLVTELPEKVLRYYSMERDRLERRREQLNSFKSREGMTSDGHGLEVGANIASSEQATIAFDNGAQGIGLFRTEMIFLDREAAPSETEQTEIYTAAAKAGKGKPVIIRLMDIGGDKPAPYLSLPAEENPFLGYRGARIYKEFALLLHQQIRAILRASSFGNVKILVPMICCLEEVREIRQMIDECRQQLAANGTPIERLPQLGVMVEVPSLAFLMPELCEELDFFSIGSNDLTQYFLAADRANQKVAALYTWSHPAFLRLLKSVVDQAKSLGKWIGLCGEMGDQPAALKVLIGLGLDEISVSPARIGDVKAAIGAQSFADCRQLLDELLKCSARAEVEALLQNSSATQQTAPLILPELIIKSDAITKEEAIKQVSAQLYLSGRVSQPRLIEEAIWKREDTYSTGFGYGFALPHCKSEYLTANSIVIAKLATPVEWGSLDEKPVDVVIHLAVREQEHAVAHMKIFAKLSRLVMRDEFRDTVRGESDPVRLTEFLKQSLGIS